ncbi:hypothetical protein A1D31_36180 [Bradyrhizobium liaoningense]|nr:hypothetical protein A1D31_36180 [Bradyrhizobium liaoningense]
MRDVFDRIFHENKWGSADSRSGEGGELSQTTTIRAVIPEIIAMVGARSMLDLPCGDFNWMRFVDLGIDYIGADIVPELIAANQTKYGNDHRRFIVHDVAQELTPEVDLILCRDLLVHFSFEHIRSAYGNLRASGSGFILTTTFPLRPENAQIKTGEWRPLNLSLPPFNFPKPIRIINENCTEWDGHWSDKSLGLWRIADLPEILPI